jgi:hypothetical protein
MAKPQDLILLAGSPLLQRFFRASTPIVALRLMLPGVFLAGLALLAGVHSVPVVFPNGQAEDVGIWWQPNWALAYLVLAPGRLSARLTMQDAARRGSGPRNECIR